VIETIKIEGKKQEFVSKLDYDKLLADYDKLFIDSQNSKYQLEDVKHQLEELKRLIFGKKSERYVSAQDDGQLSLFDIAQDEEAEPEKEEINYTRTKSKKEDKKAIRKLLPAHLPRKEEIIEPENLPENTKKIGAEITEILEYIPQKLYVRQIIRPKYVVIEDKKDKKNLKTQIIISDLPSLPLPKSNAGAGLLTYITTSKFIDHLPFYRLISIFKREGVEISQSTMGGWFSRLADLLRPLHEELKNELLHNAEYLTADESPIKVQDKTKKGANHQGYMWVYRNFVKRLVLFKYSPSRGQAPPKEILKDFKGILQTDGYQVYQLLSKEIGFQLLGCMAHIRRYYEKALDNDKTRANYVLKRIQELYAIERKVKEEALSVEEIKEYRLKYSKPIMDDIEQYIKEQGHVVLPKSSIGKAFSYTLKIFPNMRNYLNDGSYQIDNNLTENVIRPLALGRKNYLFAGSHKAAEDYAMFYSFFATCKVNQVNPYEWLNDVLNRIPEHKANKLSELLPNNWKNSAV
jgi:transposase